MYKFQCRKRHMFVATIRNIDGLNLEESFNAASGICSLQPHELNGKEVFFAVVSMPQAAYVRCNWS